MADRRAEILSFLPTVFPVDKELLLIIPGEYKGINQIKTLISDLNRKAGNTWIWADYSNQPSLKVGSNVALVATFFQIGQAKLDAIRGAARKAGIPYIPQALTVGDLRFVINTCAERRPQVAKKNGTPVAPPLATPAPGIPQPLLPVAPETEVVPVGEIVSDVVEQVSPEQPVAALSSSEAVDAAVGALENVATIVTDFQTRCAGIIEEAQFIVMGLTEHMTSLMLAVQEKSELLRRTSLEHRTTCETKDTEIGQLRWEVERLKQEKIQNEKDLIRIKLENSGLAADLKEKQKTLAGLADLLKGATGK